MFPNVQELLLHQERQHYPCPYHDTCLMVCFKSPFDLQMHLSKTHNDSGGSLAKRGRGIQVTLQELQSAHEEMEPREGRGARRRPPAERPPERSPRERKNAQVLTLSKQNRDLLKRHVLWRFKKQISEEDRVVAGERLQEGIEQLPDDFQKNTIRLSQQMHDPRMTPTAMFDLVQHLVTVDAVLADVPPIDLSWRRLHVPTFCELIYLVVISYPLVGRRPAIEAALKDLVFDSGARTIRAAPKQLPVLPSAVPDSTDGIPAPFRSRVVIKDSFQKSLQLALKTLRHGCRVAVSRLSPSQQDILSNYAKESRLQLTPLHEVLSDAVGPRTCDQILALRADYFRAKMLQDEPLWVERCWHTFIDVGQEQRDLVADFLLMSEELPEPVSPESTNGPEEFPTLDGEPVTPRARMPERSKPDGCDFPSLGDSMPDAYKRVPRPKMRQVTTRTVSLAEFATKPKVVKRNMILTDDDETFPSLLSCQDAQLDRDKRVERTFKKMLAKKKPLPTPAVEPEFPSLGGDIIRRVPPVKAVPAVKAASPASRVVRVNPADSLGTVSLEPFSFPSLIGNTPAVSPTPGSAAVGRGFLNAHRPAGHPKPESSPKLRKADIPPLTAFPSLEDDCLPETTTKMCNFCGSRQRNAHVVSCWACRRFLK
ncbi:MAG: hypothetical protein KVP17_001157 [Porospora cf. gigantea B]|uniref:uncharacterized protein n=1 Tax=Porospora cf. gigantea B TaxID=2853592 RepID=UPI0035719726|nr:MAG: hypothetical protein KVP17_001157 [Porospora cf. gigantea B]